MPGLDWNQFKPVEAVSSGDGEPDWSQFQPAQAEAQPQPEGIDWDQFALAPQSESKLANAIKTDGLTGIQRQLDQIRTDYGMKGRRLPLAARALGQGAGGVVQMTGGGLEAQGRRILTTPEITEDTIRQRVRDSARDELLHIRALAGDETPVTEIEIDDLLAKGSIGQSLAKGRGLYEMEEQQRMKRLTGQIINPASSEFAKWLVSEGTALEKAGGDIARADIFKDEYHDTKAVSERLKDRPFETVMVEGLKQAPNLMASYLGAQALRRIGIGGVAAPYVGASITSYAMESGDIFTEGKDELIRQYGSEDKIPSDKWNLLATLSSEHGAFNAVLDSVTPGSLAARAMLGKALVTRLLSAEGAKYIGKEALKDLTKEVTTELAQEESTMQAVEKSTGRVIKPDERLERYLAVVAGTIIPAGGGSVLTSASNIRQARLEQEGELIPQITPKTAPVQETVTEPPQAAQEPRQPIITPEALLPTDETVTQPSEPAMAEEQPIRLSPGAQVGIEAFDVNVQHAPRGADDKEISQRTTLPVWESVAATGAEEVFDLPSGIYAELAESAPTEFGAAQERQLQELRSRLSEAGANPEEAVRAVWGTELANASPRLRQAITNNLAMSKMSYVHSLSLKQGPKFSPSETTTIKDATGNVTQETAVLRDSLARYLGKELPAEAFVGAALSEDFAPAADAIREVFGKRVVLIRNNNPELIDFNGAVIPEAKDVIFVNENSDAPFLVTVGHELTHHLRKEQSALYKILHDAAVPRMQGTDKYKAWLDAARKREGAAPASMDTMEEELIADFIGEHWQDREFWAAMQRKSPGQFRRLIKSITDWLNRLLDTMRKGRVASQYFREVEALRDEAAAIFAEYAVKTTEKIESEPTPAFSPTGGPEASSVREAVNRATDKIAGVLGLPAEGVTIQQRKIAKQPGIMNPLRSPRRVAKKYPEFRPFFDQAVMSTDTQEKLRDAFNKRLARIERILGNTTASGVPGTSASRQYKANKKLLAQIRWMEDTLGHEFTEQELREDFGANDRVIAAHRLMRAAYNHALDLANRVRELRGKLPVNKREGYVPHFFHNYFISVDGSLTASARTLREAVKIANELTEGGTKQVKIRAKEFEFPGEAVQAAILGDGQYFKVKAGLEDKLSLSPDEGQELLDGLARRRGRSRFVGNFLQRKGAEGFETDIDYVDRHYFNMISRYVALEPFKSRSISLFERRFGPFSNEHEGIAGYIKNYINDINGVPTHMEELLNASIARTPAIGKFLGHYLGDRPAIQIASMATNAVSIAKLGFYNVSAAIVNLTQLNNLQTLIGPRWAVVGMAKSIRITGEKVLEHVGQESIDQDIGILKKAGVPVQMGLESGAGYSRTAQMGKLFRASLFFFKGVETHLRRAAVLGAYYKAVHDGMTSEQALKYAQEVNTKANFDYSIADTPSIIRRGGPISQLLLQFKKFPIKQIELMMDLRGMQHARFWLPMFLMAGYFGFPGMELLKNILKRLFGFDMELELKEYLIKWAGDDPEKKAIAKTIMYGAVANDELGGIDLSHRVGAGDFIPSDADDLLGPFLSTSVRAVQLASRREWAETMRAISTAPGNIWITLAEDGRISSPWDRDRLIVKLGKADQAKKMLGFRPASEAIETDTARIMRYERQQLTARRQKLIDEAIKAEDRYMRRPNDSDAKAAYDKRVKEIYEEAAKHNIKITNKVLREEREKKDMTRGERAWGQVPKRQRGELKDVEIFRRSENPP